MKYFLAKAVWIYDTFYKFFEGEFGINFVNTFLLQIISKKFSGLKLISKYNQDFLSVKGIES